MIYHNFLFKSSIIAKYVILWKTIGVCLQSALFKHFPRSETGPVFSLWKANTGFDGFHTLFWLQHSMNLWNQVVCVKKEGLSFISSVNHYGQGFFLQVNTSVLMSWSQKKEIVALVNSSQACVDLVNQTFCSPKEIA